MNVKNAKGDDNRRAAIPNIIHDSLNTTWECGIFHLLGSHDN